MKQDGYIIVSEGLSKLRLNRLNKLAKKLRNKATKQGLVRSSKHPIFDKMKALDVKRKQLVTQMNNKSTAKAKKRLGIQ